MTKRFCIYDSKKRLLCLSYSSTNGFQENHTFSFANVLPHGVCSAVYHPQHSLLIIGSLIGQGQRNSTGEYEKKLTIILPSGHF